MSRLGWVSPAAGGVHESPNQTSYVDQFVWSEIIRLLDDPELVQAEIDRRRETARNADPRRKREDELRREQVRIEKSSERLVTAYQEGLVTLPQLRRTTEAVSGCRSGITIFGDGGGGRSKILATGRKPRRIPNQVAFAS